MIRSAVIMTIIFVLSPTGEAFGQMPGSADTLSMTSDSSPADSGSAVSLGMLMIMMDDRMRPATSLSFYSRPDMHMHLLMGYETYRASPYECALRGAGAGMSLGMAAGAFGMMTGAWDERRAWYIAGAAAAAGALFGTIKSDDPGWSIGVRLDPDH